MPHEIEICESTAVDTFCEALGRIERIGSCRRLVFVVTERYIPGGPVRSVAAKLVFPAEAMANLAQMIAAESIEPSVAFARLPIDAVAN